MLPVGKRSAACHVGRYAARPATGALGPAERPTFL